MDTIPLDQINVHDRRFCITYPLADEGLLDSVRKIGIIQPVLLLNGTPFIVITGFKRVDIARQLGRRTVPGIVLTVTEREAIVYAIHDNLKRGLNIVEKGLALERMLHLGFTAGEVFETMGLLGLKPHDKILNQLIALASGEEELKTFVVERSLSMKNIGYLLRFEVEERARILALFSTFRLTESLIREILEMMTLCKIRKGEVPFQLLPVSSAQELVRGLKALTNPILTALQEKLQEFREVASLPPNIDIKVDPFFEKEYIDIGIRAESEDDILHAIHKLDNLIDNGCIGSILELTKGHLR
jgi:hypothetical protein